MYSCRPAQPRSRTGTHGSGIKARVSLSSSVLIFLQLTCVPIVRREKKNTSLWKRQAARWPAWVPHALGSAPDTPAPFGDSDREQLSGRAPDPWVSFPRPKASAAGPLSHFTGRKGRVRQIRQPARPGSRSSGVGPVGSARPVRQTSAG